MKKFATLLGLTLASLGLAVPSASASISDSACTNYDGQEVTTCLTAYFERQADGSGVRLEGYEVNTPRNCDNLEDTPYTSVALAWVNNNRERVNYTYYENNHGCTLYRDVSNAGYDRGSMVLEYEGRARVNNGRDRQLYFGIQLNPDGSSSVRYAFDTESQARQAARVR